MPLEDFVARGSLARGGGDAEGFAWSLVDLVGGGGTAVDCTPVSGSGARVLSDGVRALRCNSKRRFLSFC